MQTSTESLVAKPFYKHKLFWGIIIGLIAVSSIIFFGYRGHANKNLATAVIIAPQITPLADELKPNHLSINFSKAVAPLELVGKDIAHGVTITPDIAGKWSWSDDSRLVFTPTTDWPANQEYDIKCAKNVFAAGSKLAKYTFHFTTRPFNIQIPELKFYSSPVDPESKQVVATVSFNYPVNPVSLENNLHLTIQTLDQNKQPGPAQPLAFKVSYDKFKRTAYLTSDNIALTATARFAKLTIDKPVQALKGPGASTEVISKSTLIPDLASYFKVTAVTADIMRNPQNRPEQILHIESTLGINETELAQNLHVYLLPEKNSAKPQETNYQWQIAEVTPEVLQNSTTVALQAIPAEHDYATIHNYKFMAPESRYLYVKLDHGLKSFGGYSMPNDYNEIVKAPEFPKEISFLHAGSLLALNGEQKISVVARGIPAIKFRIARVLPDSVNHLITQTKGDFSNPEFVDYHFNENDISEIFTTITQFNNSDAAKEQYTAIDLAKYLAAPKNVAGPLGLFLLHAQGWDPDKKQELDVTNNRLILLTDMGLLVKNNQDASHDIFVSSITQGVPVANAAVAVLGRNGLPIVTRTTDATGHATIPSLNDFVEEKQPTVYLAKKGDDVTFIPYSNADRTLNYSKYDVGGNYSRNDIEGLADLSAFVFTERGIYRPGDTVHIGAIVRRLFATDVPPGLPLEINIVGPTGVTVLQQKMTLANFDYITLDYPTNATAQTGQYDITVYLTKDNQQVSMLGTTSIQLQEFLPDRLKIQAALIPQPTQGWITPQNVKANISLWNLFGAPAVNHRISGKITLAPRAIHFAKYSEYIFSDPLLDPQKPPQTVTENLADLTTNDQGIAEYALNLERFPNTTYQLTLFAEGFEAGGGRSVATQTSTLISPLEFLVGYKPDGDLNYLKLHSERSVHFIAINRDLTQIELPSLKAQLFLLKPIVTLVKKPDGTYAYQSLMQENLLKEAPLNITAEGTNFALDTTQLGDYKLVIANAAGTKVSQVNYSVVGLGAQALPKNAELQVKLNKTEYTPGETIELQINAPYVGSGLITIERDKVYAYRWFKTTANSSLQTITLPQDFQGNGYINVAYVRDWNSPEIFMSPLSYSVVPFSVARALHTVNIQLQAQELIQPGEPLTITYKTDKPGKIIVFAVDQGILQVSNYKTPDPLEFFLQKRALEVETQQILDLILPKYIASRELSAAGGDGGRRKMEISNLNPFKRKTEAPVVYWSGLVDADQTDRKLIYNVPDYFNGTLKIMAVAAAANTVGSAEKTTLVRGDYIINPNVPTFVAPGDTFTVTAGVTSNVKDSDKAPISVQLNTSPQLEIIGEATQKVTLAEKQEKVVSFKLRAHDILGNANLTFSIPASTKTISIRSTLSIRPLVPFNTTIASGYSDKKLSIKLDRDLYPEFRQVEATIATSPLILVTGLERYLNDYPYLCTEQLVSKAWPLLAFYQQPLFATEQSSLQTNLTKLIQALRERQLANGSFVYWPGVSGKNDANNKFATIYAMHFLTEAHARNLPVPLDMLNGGIAYLKDLAAADVQNLAEARLQAYAIYLLTRNEIVTTNYLTHLQDYLEQALKDSWQQDITSVYIAATYQLLQDSATAEKIINKYRATQQPETEYLWYYSNDIAAAQYLMLLAEHFPNKLPQQIDKLLLPLIAKFNSEYINTVFAGYATIALASCNQAWQSNTGNELLIKEITANKQATDTPSRASYQKIPLASKTQTVEFSSSGKPGFFYQLLQAGFDRNPPATPSKSNLEIAREYQSNKAATNSVELGKELEVHLKLRTTNDSTLDNVAVVDLLPGGFEVVRESLKSQNYDFLDIREDRVIFFVTAEPKSREIVYRIRATNIGDYAVPPAFAAAMYQAKQQAFGTTGKITVTIPK